MKNKIPMYQCKSIWNGETNQVEDCTCGRCAKELQKGKNKPTVIEKDKTK